MIKIAKRLFLLLGVNLALLLLCAALVAAALHIGQTQRASMISFVSSSGNGDNQLELMDINTGILYLLSDHNIFCCVDWSPDGDELIFDQMNAQGTLPQKHLYRMKADGSQPRFLVAPSEPSAMNAAWSPDGKYIAFVSLPVHQPADISLLDNHTGITRRLTDNTSDDADPHWSPNGKFIIFTSYTEGHTWDIYRTDLTGGDAQNLTPVPGNNLTPAVSPDSRHIAFVSDRSGNQELYVMDADGSNVRQLTLTPDFETLPVWSPDGLQILYIAKSGVGEVDINRINADGGDRQTLVDSAIEMPPVWSPDGSQILYVAGDTSGQVDIYVMDADGTHQRRLTNNDDREMYPVWRPG